MKPLPFTVSEVDYANDLPLLRLIRGSVFVKEQSVPLELEWDALDPLCRHVLARDSNLQPIGTGRLTPQHTIGRMAVLQEWRGKGVGDALLQCLIGMAVESRWTQVSLHSQVSAMGFYQKHGFQAYGDIYQEAGIAHQNMRLQFNE